jgi:rhodanese-related sulfurtransferase
MEVKRVEPQQVKELLDGDESYIYLDVRTADEFQAGHVPEAINVPVMLRNPNGPGMMPNADFLAQVEDKLQKSDKIITGCLRGGRSMKAAQILLTSGFENVTDMRGGYDGELDPGGNMVFEGWARRGLPTTTD